MASHSSALISMLTTRKIRALLAQSGLKLLMILLFHTAINSNRTNILEGNFILDSMLKLINFSSEIYALAMASSKDLIDNSAHSTVDFKIPDLHLAKVATLN